MIVSLHTICGVNKRAVPRIRIEINGHRMEEELKGEDGQEVLASKQDGHPQQVRLSSRTVLRYHSF